MTIKIFEIPDNEVVFTTTDGVGLKKGDKYWYVVHYVKSGWLIRSIVICSGQDFPKGRRQFSKREYAENFIATETRPST